MDHAKEQKCSIESDGRWRCHWTTRNFYLRIQNCAQLPAQRQTLRQRLGAARNIGAKQIIRNNTTEICNHLLEWAAKIQIHFEMDEVVIAPLLDIILARWGERYSGCYRKCKGEGQRNRCNFGNFSGFGL